MNSVFRSCFRAMSFSTRVLPTHPSSIHFSSISPTFSDSVTQESLHSAANHLRSKNCVAFPTETVYGLGALALDSASAAKIFTTKGRPPDNPLIVHVSSTDMLNTLLPNHYVIPRIYHILIKHFWPGALTLLFPREASLVPDIITAGQPTVAIRMPSHPVARALIAVTGAPIAAPSANSSGKPSPTKAEHVLRDLEGKLPIILDGGACGVGLESTVVDGLGQDGHLRVLRPGGVTVEDLERVLKEEMGHDSPRVLVHRRDYRDEVMEQTPTTPGMKYRHYSPAVPVLLLDPLPSASVQFADVINTLRSRSVRKIGVMALDDSPIGQHPLPTLFEWCRFPLGPRLDPSVAAQRLFDGLISLESQGVDMILVEAISEEREGLAVMNRIRKAAGETIHVALDPVV